MDEAETDLKITTEQPATVQMRDPLPESRWFFRRIITYVVVALLFGVMIVLGVGMDRLVSATIGKLNEISGPDLADIMTRALETIERMFFYCFLLMAMMLTYYLVAPTAEQIVKMFKYASIIRSGMGSPEPDASWNPRGGPFERESPSRRYQPREPDYRGREPRIVRGDPQNRPESTIDPEEVPFG